LTAVVNGLLPTRTVEGCSFEEKCGVWGKENATDISGSDVVEKEASYMRCDLDVPVFDHIGGQAD
jgi:hypothetical protein